MRMTEAGLALIKRFEGYRGEAYLCPAGVWTIGYGHTSVAGNPAVTRGAKMNREEAARVAGKMEEIQQLQRQITDERTRLEEERDSEKERVRRA